VRGWLITILYLGLAGFAEAGPARPAVVSLDYCADQYVLALADRSQIRALSKDSERAFSHLRRRAAGIAKVRAAAEDVIALRPDIVVRSWGGDARALGFYRRLGIRTVQIVPAGDVPGAAGLLRAVAGELGQEARAEEIIAAMPAARPGSGEQALYVTPGGVSAGRGTVIDALMAHAGLENANPAAGWTGLPLEQLALRPPERVLAAFFGFEGDLTDQWSVSRHPVMARLMASAEVIDLEEARVSCADWFLADEAAAVAAGLERRP
jgi:iron complex transport system substrate-binding protein